MTDTNENHDLLVMTRARRIVEHFELCGTVDHKGSWTRWARTIADALDTWERDRRRLQQAEHVDQPT